MPKKRHTQALLIKPGGGSSTSSNSRQEQKDQSTCPSVNDLIRESRRLQLQKEGASVASIITTTTTSTSVPPQVRQALNLPIPEGPGPRTGSVIQVPAGPVRNGATMRLRRVPGPPPPRSWLTNNRNDNTINRHGGTGWQDQYGAVRRRKIVATTPIKLPGLSSLLPRPGSLYDLTLKELARNWNWHADYYGEWLGEDLPTRTRETLLSYIAMYSCTERPNPNPLRLLFMADLREDSRAEVARLDLTGAIGTWITLRQLQRSLGPVEQSTAGEDEKQAGSHVPEAWDEGTAHTEARLQRVPSGPMFKNLQHLSLALSPGQTSGASWKDLIQLAGKVSTIASLSLAFWPLPTYTPRAASTRVVIPSTTPRPQVLYGGTNMYSPFDDDWRESAGILRSLSRALYCLKWLDLTGCAPWLPALTWTGEEGEDYVMPDWNGWWRGVQHVCLGVGWEAVEPQPKPAEGQAEDDDHEYLLQKHAYEKDRREHETLAGTAKTVAEQLRAIRRLEGGKWIEFEF